MAKTLLVSKVTFNPLFIEHLSLLPLDLQCLQQSFNPLFIEFFFLTTNEQSNHRNFQSPFHRVSIAAIVIAAVVIILSILFSSSYLTYMPCIIHLVYIFQSSFHRVRLYLADSNKINSYFQSSFHRVECRVSISNNLTIKVFQSSFHRGYSSNIP